MRIVHLAAPVLTLALIGAVTGQDARPKEAGHTVASPELTKALARAGMHNKRVIALLVGEGEDLAGAWKKNRTISRTLLYEFEIVQFAGKAADAMAVQLGWPDAVEQKPVGIVFDSDQKELARLAGAELATDGKDNGEAFLAKLKPHVAAPVDAEKKLAAALAEAKKTGRNVFIRFDAPW